MPQGAKRATAEADPGAPPPPRPKKLKKSTPRAPEPRLDSVPRRLDAPVLDAGSDKNVRVEAAIRKSLDVDPNARSECLVVGHTIGEQVDRLLAALRWGDKENVKTTDDMKDLILGFAHAGVAAFTAFGKSVHQWATEATEEGGIPQPIGATRSYVSTLKQEVIIWAYTIALHASKIFGRSSAWGIAVKAGVGHEVWTHATEHCRDRSARRGLSAFWLAVRMADPRSLLTGGDHKALLDPTAALRGAGGTVKASQITRADTMCEWLLQFIEYQLETREEVRALQIPIEACLPAHVTAMFCPLIEHQNKTSRVGTDTRREVFVEAGIEQHKQRGRAWHVAGAAALDLQSPADAWSQRHMPKTVNGHRAKPIMLGEGARNLGPKAQALWTLHYLGEAFLMPELYTMARAFTAEPDRSVEDVEQDDVTLRTVGISVARTATVINDKAYGLPSPRGQDDSVDGRFTLLKDPIVVFCGVDEGLLTSSAINTTSGTMVALMVGTTADKHAVRKDLLHFAVRRTAGRDARNEDGET